MNSEGSPVMDDKIKAVLGGGQHHPGGENVARYVEAARAVPGMASVLLPVGTGIQVSRYDP